MMRRNFARPLAAGLCACMLAGCATPVPPPEAAARPAPPPAAAKTATATTAKTSSSTAAPPAATASAVPVASTVASTAAAAPAVPSPDATAREAFVRDTAARYGIAPQTIESALAGASIRDGIIAAMSRPAEAKPWRDYRPIFLTPARIDAGRDFLAVHRTQLAAVEARTGVPAELVVAIIGVETMYGANTGSYPVVDALYTLAFAYPRSGDPARAAREDRRERFFRDELGQLFALGKETGMDVTRLTGSYAGAMGWGQFMPSSYRDYAVDGDGDGDRDLFGDLDDVFASVANYFVRKGGWERGGQVMVRASRDPDADPFKPEDWQPRYTLDELAARGFHPAAPVADPAARATLVTLDGVDGPEDWIAFNNFYAITRYNNSALYSTAVWQLAQAIAAPAAAADPPPA